MHARQRLCAPLLRSLLFAVIASACCVAQHSEVRVQKLDINYNDADISPDGKLVAVTVSHVGDNELLWRDEVQLWDWRAGKQAAVQVTRSPIKKKPYHSRVRFAADGKLLVVTSTSPPMIKVFTVPELKPARDIALDEVNDYDDPILAIETSPSGYRVAVLFAEGPSVELWNNPPNGDLVKLARNWAGPPSRISIFDLDTGAKSATADLDRWASSSGSLSWSEDGKKIAAIGNDGDSCDSKQGSRVKVFDAASGETLRRFDARFAETVVFASGDQMLVAEYNCEGILQQKMPTITIYDAGKGKPLRKLSGGPWEVRHQIHVSADRRRAIGYVEQQSTGFSPADGGYVWYDVNENRKFLVWEIASAKVIAESPAFRYDNEFGIMHNFRLNRDGSVAIAFNNLGSGNRSNSVIAVAEVQ